MERRSTHDVTPRRCVRLARAVANQEVDELHVEGFGARPFDESEWNRQQLTQTQSRLRHGVVNTWRNLVICACSVSRSQTLAAARKVLTLVYYGLRDGEIRSLAPPEAA